MSSSMDFNLSGIVLLTGVPGSGKTLRAMEILERSVKEGRPTFQCGINQCSLPGVQEWPDPHAWKELPPRAVLVVDEAQDHFRTRPGSVRPPESITDMERIRHSAVCLVLTTQQPTYLDKHVRGLVGRHEHLVEVLAGATSNVYAFRSTREELTERDLTSADFLLWAHPKHLRPFYKSAEAHTKRTRIPFRFKVLGAAVLAFVALALWLKLGPSDAAPAAEAGEAASAAPPPPSGRSGRYAEPLTPMEYAARLVPRFSNLPGSAPIFDDREAQSEPAVYCMEGGPGHDASGRWIEASVTCLTEQGTRYMQSPEIARRMARHGPSYDPFKAPSQAGQATFGAAATPQGGGDAPTQTAPPGAVISGAQVIGDEAPNGDA